MSMLHVVMKVSVSFLTIGSVLFLLIGNFVFAGVWGRGQVDCLLLSCSYSCCSSFS